MKNNLTTKLINDLEEIQSNSKLLHHADNMSSIGGKEERPKSVLSHHRSNYSRIFKDKEQSQLSQYTARKQIRPLHATYSQVSVTRNQSKQLMKTDIKVREEIETDDIVS